MAALRVLEWVRFRDGIWNLPGECLEPLRREFADVEFLSPLTREQADAALPTADVVLGFAVRRDNFASAARLRWIHVTAASVANVLFPELVRSRVEVTNARGLHALSMAEHALGVMLAFARKLHHARDAQRERRWSQTELWESGPPFATLEGATLGLVGFGHIGRAVAAKARAIGMRVIAVRRHPAGDPEPAHEQWGVERLGDLLAQSDWVVLAPPLTPETQGLIGEAELARLKPGARLVNLGRGALVDEPALVRALESGRLAGAALDVFADEPLPASSPLWSHPEVIVTPHVSGLGPHYWERALEQFAANLRRFRSGEPLANRVDKQAGY